MRLVGCLNFSFVFWQQSCLRSAWKNGICDYDCNNEACDYDGGDCSQTCSCDIDLWFNGVCDESCNNTICAHDFYSCDHSTQSNRNTTCASYYIDIDYTASNYSSLTSDIINNTNDDSNIIDCYEEWTTDLWCDSACSQSENCNYDSGYCVECDGTCATAYGYAIDLLGGLYEPYELVTISEICEHFDVLDSLLTNVDENSNCTQVFDMADTNGNGFIGFYEAIVFTAESWGLETSVHYNDKIKQIDCSICMQNASLYYW